MASPEEMGDDASEIPSPWVHLLPLVHFHILQICSFII